MLTGHRQRLPAGCQHLHVGRGSQHLRHEPGDGGEQMLAVVHHEQELLGPQVGQQEVEWFGGRLVPQVERCHGSVAHERWIEDFSELDQPRAVAETPAKVGCRPDRQARLADAARPDQTDQPGIGELLPNRRELAAASDEARGLSRNVARAADGPSHHRNVYGSGTESVRLGTGSAISPMRRPQRVPSVTSMHEQPSLRRVEVSFVGPAPGPQVERASGVSDVEIDGSILRCLVWGSFQPFLEALRGHEVLGFSATPRD